MVKEAKGYFIVAVLIFLAVLVIGAGLLFKKKLFGAASDSPNFVAVTSVTNTTTGAIGLPTLLLASNYGRLMARCTNLGTSSVFMYMQNFTNATAASTTVLTNGGIMLSPAASTTPNFYDIQAGNLYNGQIWATSTSSGVRVSCIEGQ